MSRSTMQYEDVVLGRYYIDNWIMGMIHLNHGFLIDTTEAGTFSEYLATSQSMEFTWE